MSPSNPAQFPNHNTASAWAFIPSHHQLRCGHVFLALTPTECRLIAAMLHWPPGAVVPRKALLDALPGASHAGTAREVDHNTSTPPGQRALNMAISRLRHKARQAGAILPLQTVSREGYAL